MSNNTNGNLTDEDIELLKELKKNIKKLIKRNGFVYDNGRCIIPAGCYGDSLPDDGIEGQIFFKIDLEDTD